MYRRRVILRLRLSLADRSGALAQAATVVGLHGGNIRSIDVLTARPDGQGPDDEAAAAVDDLVVEFPRPPDLDALAADLEMDAAATLVASGPATVDDPVHRALRAGLAMLGGRPGPAELARGLTAVCPAVVAWTADAVEAARFECGARALAGSQPVVARTGDLPAAAAEQVGGEAAVVALPLVGAAGAPAVAFLARRPEWDFTPIEVSRASAVAELYQLLTSGAAGPPSTGGAGVGGTTEELGDRGVVA